MAAPAVPLVTIAPSFKTEVWRHTQDLESQTLIEPSLLPVMTLEPSGEKTASLTNDACPLNSFKSLPDLIP